MSTASAEKRAQTAQSTNENPAVGTCSIRGTYDELASKASGLADEHDRQPTLPRLMAGAVARFPARDVHSQDE